MNCIKMNETELIKTVINNTKECLELEEYTCPISMNNIVNPVTITTSGQTYEESELNKYINYHKIHNNIIDDDKSILIKDPIIDVKFNPHKDVFKNYGLKNMFEKNLTNIKKNISLIFETVKYNTEIVQYIIDNELLSFVSVIEYILTHNIINLFLNDETNNNYLANSKTINILLDLNISNQINFEVSCDIIMLIMTHNYFSHNESIDVDKFIEFIKNNDAVNNNVICDMIDIYINDILHHQHHIEYIFDNIKHDYKEKISNKIINYFNENNNRFIDDHNLSFGLLKMLNICDSYDSIEILSFFNRNLLAKKLSKQIMINLLVNINDTIPQYFNKTIEKIKVEIYDVFLNNYLDIIFNDISFELLVSMYNKIKFKQKEILINNICLSTYNSSETNKYSENIISRILKIEKNNELIKLIENKFFNYLNSCSTYNKNTFSILFEFYKIQDKNKKKFSEKKILKIIFQTPEKIIENEGFDMLTKIYHASDANIQKGIHEITVKMCTDSKLRKKLLENNGIHFIKNTFNTYQIEEMMYELYTLEQELFINNKGILYLIDNCKDDSEKIHGILDIIFTKYKIVIK
jgi:hypothetical protein